ncbi:TPA: hypothetical protein DEP90_01560 [Patescibacteria group bacterium]|nr:hypothetical protein [Patescibacteria group bacterium]
MTYLLITQENSIENENILKLISMLWGREVIPSNLRTNVDMHILDGRDQNSIGIEMVKDLQEEMRYKPFKESIQIAVILGAKKLTHQAQNAFLKTLEESSDATVYILLVNNESDLLPTIVSRSRKIYTKVIKENKDEKDISSFCFEDSDLIKAFGLIEGFAKDKLKSLEYLDSYLQTLHSSFRKSIKDGKNIRRITTKISLVNTTKRQIEANGNRRLLLENLYLQIQELR